MPLIALSLAGYFYAKGGRFVETENAYVKAEIVTISANVEGQVTHVLVDDNETVKAGQPLFQLDFRPFEIALAAADAQLKSARQKIEALRAQYRQGKEEIDVAKERIRYQELNHQRDQKLLQKGVGTHARFEASQHALLVARRQLKVAEETTRMALAELGGSIDSPVEEHPLYLKAKADLARTELDLSYASVFAPINGTLSNVTLEPGEYLEAGDPLFALVSLEKPWIEANLKEVQLTHVELGQEARVTIDSYPDLVWRARVESISPATGAEFAILPPQNATGNWVKVVQRVPVRLRIEETENLDLLRSGMTATVAIDTGYERKAMTLVRDVLAKAFETRD